MRLATKTPNAVSAGHQELEADHFDNKQWCEVHADQRGEDEHDGALGGRDGCSACGLAEYERGAADGCDEHFAQEPELAVPHDRHRREDCRGDDTHCDDAGKHELLEVESTGRADERRHAVAEHEQEQERLDKPGQDAGASADEANEFATPDHPDGADAKPQATGSSRAQPPGDPKRYGTPQRHHNPQSGSYEVLLLYPWVTRGRGVGEGVNQARASRVR
jgi:hypothetical protein